MGAHLPPGGLPTFNTWTPSLDAPPTPRLLVREGCRQGPCGRFRSCLLPLPLRSFWGLALLQRGAPGATCRCSVPAAPSVLGETQGWPWGSQVSPAPRQAVRATREARCGGAGSLSRCEREGGSWRGRRVQPPDSEREPRASSPSAGLPEAAGAGVWEGAASQEWPPAISQ